MKCDAVLPALEIGSWWTRRRARRHFARCPACAAAVANWQGAKHQLASTEPLTDYYRRLWRRAVDSVVEVVPRHRLRWAVGLALGSVLIVGFWLLRERPIREQPRTPLVRAFGPMQVIPLTTEMVSDQFAPLEQKLNALETEMNRFILAAEKRDAQIQLARLIQEHPKWEIHKP